MFVIIIFAIAFAIINFYPKLFKKAAGQATLNARGVSLEFYQMSSKIIGQFLSQKNHNISQISSRFAKFDIRNNNQKMMMRRDNVVFFQIPYLGKVWIDDYLAWLTRLRELAWQMLIGYQSNLTGPTVFAMIFGGDKQISDEQQAKYKVTGMLHVLSASGYNVGLIASLCLLPIRRFWANRLACILGITVIFSYAYLAEMTPSVIRAGCMVSLQLIGSLWLNRKVHPIWLLGITAIGMVWFDPSYLDNLSFQFSVMACFGILFWGWVFQKPSWFELSAGLLLDEATVGPIERWGNHLREMILSGLSLTLAAQSFIWPIQVAKFSEVSLVSLIANPLLVWLTPLITTGGVVWVTVAVSLGNLPLIRYGILPLGAAGLDLLTAGFQIGNTALAQLQWLKVSWQIKHPFPVLAYNLFLLLLGALYRHTNQERRKARYVV